MYRAIIFIILIFASCQEEKGNTNNESIKVKEVPTISEVEEVPEVDEVPEVETLK